MTTFLIIFAKTQSEFIKSYWGNCWQTEFLWWIINNTMFTFEIDIFIYFEANGMI